MEPSSGLFQIDLLSPDWDGARQNIRKLVMDLPEPEEVLTLPERIGSERLKCSRSKELHDAGVFFSMLPM